MNRVGLVGFFGWGNFGDELMLDVWRSAFAGVAEAAPVHSVLRRPYFDRAASEVADELDVVLVGGGDLILPDTVSSLYWNRAWLRRPVVVSGVGVALERPDRDDVRPRMTDFLRHPSVRSIGLRDEASASWVRALGPVVPVRSAPDLGFAAALPDPAPARGAVAVVLRKTPSADDVVTVQQIRDRARTRGLDTELLVLATGATRDEEVRGLRGAFGSSVEVVTGDSTEELCHLVGGYSAVLSAKFHGLVMGVRHGLPVASLRSTHKVAALASALGEPAASASAPSASGPQGPGSAPWEPRRVDAAAVRRLEQAAHDEVALVRRLVTRSDAHPGDVQGSGQERQQRPGPDREGTA